MNFILIGQHVLILLMVSLLMACGQKNNDDESQAATMSEPTKQQDSLVPPLYDNLGDHHYTISTDLPQVQAYFDQGMRLYYAFNHAESIRAFQFAQILDPQCAICWWGEALAWGPNINLPMDETSGRAAYAAKEKALKMRDHANPREKALIDALAVRYAKQPTEDRAYLDEAYSKAMAGLAIAYPDDQDIQVLFAESLMDLRPWDYWEKDGTPKSGIEMALTRLETVIEKNPKHPGACHFFIHAVEKLYPERAVDCAERLANLMPGAGHLVHMPGHIYIRVGRYIDAVKANQHAIHADETYIRDQNPAIGMYTAGYYPHNYDFLAFATMMIGQSHASIDAAEKVAKLIPRELLGQPGMDFLQHWSIRPLLVMIRFARWQEILDTPSPSSATSMPHATAMWHYARGRALVAVGDVIAARAELEKLQNIANSQAISSIHMEFNESVDLLAVADKVLAGWIDSAMGRHDEAERNLREAVTREDALLYGEPPEWTVPVRQDLGAVLLIAGRYEKAEQIFREDLERFPKNGWSLYGLASSLRSQGKKIEADKIQKAFYKAWETADMELLTLN